MSSSKVAAIVGAILVASAAGVFVLLTEALRLVLLFLMCGIVAVQ